ncbi:MAG: hypothetical protein WBG76_10445, partial [Ornithinimicrobium sp.]
MSTSAPTTPSTAASLGGRRQSPIQRLQHLLHAHPALSPALILVLTFIVFSMLNGRFASAASLSLMIQQTAVIACLRRPMDQEGQSMSATATESTASTAHPDREPILRARGLNKSFGRVVGLDSVDLYPGEVLA